MEGTDGCRKIGRCRNVPRFEKQSQAGGGTLRSATRIFVENISRSANNYFISFGAVYCKMNAVIIKRSYPLARKIECVD